MVFLEKQLKMTEEQLFSIRSHLWVRLGHKIRYALVWLQLLKRLGKFRAGSIKIFFSMRLDYLKDRFGGKSDKNCDEDTAAK